MITECKKCEKLKKEALEYKEILRYLRKRNRILKHEKVVLCAFILRYFQTIRNKTNEFAQTVKRIGKKKQYHNYYKEVDDLFKE